MGIEMVDEIEVHGVGTYVVAATDDGINTMFQYKNALFDADGSY
jgi:hypothetical protein